MGLFYLILLTTIVTFILGIRIVRPTHRGLIERLGKYNRFTMPGFHWIIPVIERLYSVNVTEQMVDAEPQEIITNDNLNARVAAVDFATATEMAGVVPLKRDDAGHRKKDS